MTTPIKIKEVRKEELAEIAQRREKIGLPSDDVANNLVGLCLSGGALRSASFCLGLTQALQRLGLWKFVDYLSTVSGGGYIGGYLTSSTLKDKRPVTKTNQPLNSDGTSGQPARVQRFIYGGHYLMKPWRLANKYLMGVVFINLAIFSGLVAGCALIAFLWRCLDYPAISDRAMLLGLGDDLARPFWPFWLFGSAWLLAWVVSLFRRGGDARGIVARYLLLVTFASLLIGFALLAGNGDIAGLDKYISGETESIGSNIWGPVVALVIGGLLPFLSPKRLLKSGMQPTRPWEKYLFAVASTALLVGLPLLLVGLLAREDISGYNTNPYRPLIRTDIASGDWAVLCELVNRPTDVEKGNGSPASWQWVDLIRWYGPEAVEKGSVAGQRDPKEATFEQALIGTVEEARLRAIEAPVDERPAAVRDFLANKKNNLPVQENELLVASIHAWIIQRCAMTIAATPFDKLPEQAQTEFVNALRLPRTERLKKKRAKEQAIVDLYLGNYLAFAANDLRNEKLPTFQKNRAVLLDEGQWQRWRLKSYALRCFSMLEGIFTSSGSAYDYWNSKREVELSEDVLSAALNELLASSTFLTTLLTNEKIAESAASIGTGDDHTKRINELLADARLTGVEKKKWPEYQVAEFNRLLLEQSFPNIFIQRGVIRRMVSIKEDQWSRLKWFFGGSALFLIAGMWVDLNSLSLHRYYRNCLAQAFIVPRNPKSPSIALSEMDTTEYGGPYHLITGSVGMIRKRIGSADKHYALRDCDEKTDQRWVDNFLFSRLYCGSELTDYVDTVAYEHSVPGYTHKIDLAEATALSGAALSPQHVNNWLLSFLMVAMNLSLGQYIPNPRAGRPRTRPRVLAILLSLFQKAENRPFCFVSDGGHCENLGLVQLLKRRCKLIIAADVSCDPKHHFHDLGRAIRIERVHAGIRLVALDKNANGEDQVLSTDDLRLMETDNDGVKKGNCKKHYLVARIKYPDADDGLLVYLKPSFDGDESLDLIQFRNQNAEFPHDSTSDQLFDEAQVEAYRALGYHIGMQLRYHLPPEIRVGELWDYGAKVDADQLCEWFENTDTLHSPVRSCPIVEHPAAASEETMEKIRPIYKKLIQQMRSTTKEPADILPSRFVEIVEADNELRGFGMPTAVAAIQCAVVDKLQPSATDREYCIWLLQSLELDENIATNLEESLDVLIQGAAEHNPDRVRLAAIATLAILGRGSKHRTRVRDALAEFKDDPKASIRLAVKNALSNFKDSPRSAR